MLYNHYTNEGNRIIKKHGKLHTSFAFFNSASEVGDSGRPLIIPAPQRAYIEPFVSLNSKTVGVLFHIIQN